MLPGYFTAYEAQDKVGQIVHARISFVGVPAQTPGQVVRAEHLLDGSLVVVRWSLPMNPYRRPPGYPEDYFTKEQYQEWFYEVLH